MWEAKPAIYNRQHLTIRPVPRRKPATTTDFAARDGYKMTKPTIPLLAEDISHFTRVLAQQLKGAAHPPSHLGLMNMLSRAAGFRNFQHFRAAHAAGTRLAGAQDHLSIDHQLVEKTLHQFDALGRMKHWPSRRKIQELSLWAFWARLPARTTLQEPDVNAALHTEHLFGDPAILRRSLCGLGLVTRNRDGSDYRRCEQKPPAEARALIRILETRYGARQGQ